MSLNQRLIRTNDTGGGGGSTTEWIASDDLGNLFYTEDVTGLTGWQQATGVSFGGYIYEAVYNGSVWLTSTASGIWQTSDSTAKTGWSKVAGGTQDCYSVMWTGTGWLGTINNALYYTTDVTGLTNWTLIQQTSSASYSDLANDGTKYFLGIRDEIGSIQEFGYSSSGFYGSLLSTNAGLTNNFSRGAYYDPANGYYFCYGVGTNIAYATSITGSFTSVNAAGGSNGYGFMDYNGTYYVLDSTDQNGIVYSTSSTSGWAGFEINSSLNWDRFGSPVWNGTSWGTGGRYTSGDKVFAFRNNINPAGTWTGISKPTGFNGNRSLNAFPSKRPYYNNMTNLGF